MRKPALPYACSENCQDPRITVAGIDWAWAMVEHQNRRMLYMADLSMADSEFDGDCRKGIEILTRWANRKPGEFTAHWDLNRRLKWPEKKIEEFRESLVARDLIEVQMPQGGPMKRGVAHARELTHIRQSAGYGTQPRHRDLPKE